MENILSLYEKWCRIPDKIRFLIIGGINAGLSYIVFAITLFLLGHEHYQICVALQWILSSFASFANQKIFVFCTKGNWVNEYFRCCTTWAVSYVFNVVILEVFVRFLHINVYLAQILAIFSVSALTYSLFKYFAFKVDKKQS